MNCPLCERVKITGEGKYPYLIHEFKNSYLMLGEHQFFKGYCVLLAKDHHKEMTELPANIQSEIFQELMSAQRALEAEFKPTKMNLCSLGNVVPHIHWHLFPRYQSDPEFMDPPWLRMKDFSKASISPDEAKERIVRIRLRIVE